MSYKVYTQATWALDDCERSGYYPSLTDPEAEVYTVAELIARHERGILTNLNIGRDSAYPVNPRLDDRDLEKDLRMEPTDRVHLANELDESLEPIRKAQKEAEAKKLEEEAAKKKADEEARIEAEIAKRLAAKKVDEGKT